MKRTVMTAALFAAFAMPAFADEVIIKNEDSARMTKAETTTMTPREDQVEKAATTESTSGCMKRRNTALNMM